MIRTALEAGYVDEVRYLNYAWPVWEVSQGTCVVPFLMP
jgi:hypothetical protein